MGKGVWALLVQLFGIYPEKSGFALGFVPES